MPNVIRSEIERRQYRALRASGHPARIAYGTLKARQAYDAARDLFGPFPEWTGRGYRATYVLDLPTDYAVHVVWCDDDYGVEWPEGYEPTDFERENARSLIVSVIVERDGVEIYSDGIGGIEYCDGAADWSTDSEDRAVGCALHEYLLDAALGAVTDDVRARDLERTEAAYWRSRDVVTV